MHNTQVLYKGTVDRYLYNVILMSPGRGGGLNDDSIIQVGVTVYPGTP